VNLDMMVWLMISSDIYYKKSPGLPQWLALLKPPHCGALALNFQGLAVCA
jgi:hypothetical protein